MPKNKDQHYVPKMLMKRFAYPNHSFSFLYKNGENIKPITNIPYDYQCQYDYYYGRDAEWEKELSIVEKNVSIIFDKIDGDWEYYPTPDEIGIIKKFFLAQHTRTPRIVEWTKSNSKRAYIESYRLYKRNKLFDYKPLTDAEIKWIEENKSDEFEEDAKEILRSLSSKDAYVSDLELIIVHFVCKRELILSDDPVIIVNPFMHSAGFISIGIEMLMPISTKTLLVLRDPVLFTDVDRIIKSNRDKEANAINMYQAISFDKRLMFKREEDLPYVQDLIDKTSNDKKRFIKTGEGASFYGINDCMVIQHHPTLLPNYPYYFSSIKPQYRQFKFFDSLTYRFQRDKYLERVDTLLPFVATKDFSNIDGKHIPKYRAFTIHYWNEHKKYETVPVDFKDDENDNATTE